MSVGESYVEEVVCNVKEIGDKFPSMKEVDVGKEGKCLLIRHEDGEVTAIGHKCSHYGAPLARGSISKGIVRCPWHGACFNGKTGDIEDYPGIDSLHKFQVSVDKRSGDVKVRANVKHLKEPKRNSCLESCVDSCGKDTKVVIVGGGPASLVCAENLRKEGYVGDITILSNETHLPYDRAKLSKAPDADPASIYLRPNIDYFKNIRVDLHLQTEVTSIDTHQKKVLYERVHDSKTEEGSISYDRLFVATGGKPRTLHPLTGWDSSNILVLRTVDDANKMASLCKDKEIVLVGSSFIAMEIAAYLAKKKECSAITVVCGKRSKVPFHASLGAEIGGFIKKMHEDKGIKFHTSVGVEELICDDDTKTVKQLKLSDGTVLKADVVILGIGVVPVTTFLEKSGIRMNDRGYVEVDCSMKTSVDGVYAGGDIVTFPLEMKGGEATNIQHWQMAHLHGRVAAESIVDSFSKVPGGRKSKRVNSVPFFWTVQFGISLRYAGHSGKFDRVIIKGITKDQKVVEAEEALAAKKFVAFYVKNDEVLAVATMMADPIAARFASAVKNEGVFKISGIDSFLTGEGERGKGNCILS